MRFFNESDFINYKNFLMQSIENTVDEITNKDKTIKAIFIGEFPDGQFRFVTVHPYSERTHIHHPEYDHYGSLMLDLAPTGCNMFILEVNHAIGINGRTEEDC